MDPFTIAAIASVGGNLLGGIMGDQTNRRNLRAQQARQREIDAMFQQNRPRSVDMGAFMSEYAQSQTAPSDITFNMMDMPGSFSVDGANFQPAAVSPMDAQFAEFTGLGRSVGQNFNVGQDAIAQFLRADPLQLSENARLANAADTGFGADSSNVLATLSQMQDIERERAMAEIRGASGSVGQRFGSAVRQQEQRALENMLTANNAQRAQLALGVAENTANRRLAATQQLAQLGLANRQFGLGAAQSLASNALQFGQADAQMANQMAQFNAGNANSARQFNAQQAAAMNQFNSGTALQAGQFNANLAMQQLQQNFQNRFNVQQANNQMGMAAQQQSIGNRLAQRQFGLSALQAGTGLDFQRQGLINQQLAVQAGMQPPTVAPSPIPSAISDAGQFLAFLPMMRSMMGGQGGMQGGGVQSVVSPLDFPQRMNTISMGRN